MKDEIISFETAKLAKEKGFNEATSIYYCTNGEINGTKMGMGGLPNNYHGYAAPTQSILQRWLRETKDMWVTVMFDAVTYYVSIYGRHTPTDEEIIIDPIGHENWFITYEQALEEGLLQTLKLIKNN